MLSVNSDPLPNFARWPVAAYGFVLFMAAIAYFILARALVSLHGKDSTLAASLGADVKGKISVTLYALAIPVALIYSWLALALFIIVEIMWFIPDRRIESTLRRQ
ncbi:MAG: hypothetical protein J5I90_13585 [Caldilineales bacterium]|nr:hypothetical protein [Caldilineales bacterium]